MALMDEELHAEGILSLMTDVWKQVHMDLQSEQPKVQLAAHEWVHSPYFERLLNLCGGKNVEQARRRILDLYWPKGLTVEQVMAKAAERAAIKSDRSRAYRKQWRDRKRAA